MNYEALGRYTTAKEQAHAACQKRNNALFALKRWADSASNSDQLVALDGSIGSQLLRDALRANEEFDAAVIAANSVADAADRSLIDVRAGYFKA